MKKRAIPLVAPSPSPHRARPIPYGLVSLWDMINFSLEKFMLARDLIQIEITQSRKEDAKEVVSPAKRPSYIARKVSEILLPLALQRTNSRVHRFISRTADDQAALRYGDYFSQLRALAEAIADDIKEEHFYHYSKTKGAMVAKVADDWATVIGAFPASREDIVAAVDCYALGHDHASIFHSMMVLERGIPALAKRVGATFGKDRPTWKDMIDDIRQKIDTRRLALHSPPKGSKPLTKTAAKKERALLEAAGEAALEFKFFEHAWRNHLAHGRADYDENDAKKVLEHTRTFMEVIATKLKLKERK